MLLPKSSSANSTVNYTVRLIICVITILLLEISLGLYMYQQLKLSFQEEFAKGIQSGLCKNEIRRLMIDPEFLHDEIGQTNVEFFIPEKLKSSRPKDDSWISVTKYSRIPLKDLQDFCQSTRGYCQEHSSLKRKRRRTNCFDNNQETRKPSGGVSSFRGSSGVSGPQGPPGAPGPVGPRGSPGPPGVQGPQGLPGPRGGAGAQGPRGEVGPRGVSGQRGAPGLPGAQGGRGPPGASGAPGSPGPQGRRGAAGPPGFAGARGQSGAGGAPGPRGRTGSSGLPGYLEPKGLTAGRDSEFVLPAVGKDLRNKTGLNLDVRVDFGDENTEGTTRSVIAERRKRRAGDRN